MRAIVLLPLGLAHLTTGAGQAQCQEQHRRSAIAQGAADHDARKPAACFARRVKLVTQKNIFPKERNYDLTKTSRPDSEGRSANRHDTLGGMRWTRLARRRCG